MRASHIIPIPPLSTNSTHFTSCCEVAICDDQLVCPRCKNPVIGFDAETDHERGVIRSKDANRLWKKINPPLSSRRSE